MYRKREDELEFGGGGRATNANGRKNVARLAGPHTRDDLTLPDQGMDDLMCRAAGGDLYNRRVGGVGGNENEFNPFDINDSQRLPEYDPHEYDSDDAGLPPLPLDDDDETYQPSKPTAAAQGTGTGTGTGTGLNVTHSSVAPSPAALELEAAARNRGMNQVQPVRKQRAARPGTARHRMQVRVVLPKSRHTVCRFSEHTVCPYTAQHETETFLFQKQTIDAETHLGGDAYRMWLHDNSDTVLEFGRPFPADLHVDITRDARFFTASDEKIVREGFFDACFLQGDRGGILFKADAADGVCYQLRDHFASFFEARRQPWPVAVPLRQRNARDEPGRPRHPEEDLAAEAEALAEEAEREMAMERQRERRGRAKHLKRSEALGDLSSDDEGGYKPGPIAMGGEDDEHYLPPMDDDDEHELPPMDDDDDGAEAAQNHDAFRNTRAPNRNGLSLADLLEGCSVDETHSFSVGVSQNKSGSQGEIRSGDFFGSENAGDAPSSIGAAAASASRSKTKSLTQYVLKKSCTPGDSIDATGAAMNAAANSASVGNVGSAAYNLMQFLARAVFVEPPGVDEDGADGDGNKNDAKKHQPLRAASLQTLCVANALSKSKAARCFYQTLVLVGGGFLDVKQDLSVPYGEILIRPGKRFEAASGGKRARAEEETEDDEESGNSETDADEGEVPEVSHEMTEVSEDVSEVPESPPGRVPARRSKRARRG